MEWREFYGCAGDFRSVLLRHEHSVVFIGEEDGIVEIIRRCILHIIGHPYLDLSSFVLM